MKYLSSLILIFSINSFAITCVDDDIDLNPGDVISADMIKDIFDRISNVTSGITPDELDGIWKCRTIISEVGSLNGFSPDSDGMTSTMIQDINFQKQSDNTFLITFPNFLTSARDDVANVDGGAFVSGSSCKAKLLEGTKILTAHNGGTTCAIPDRVSNINKISKSCIVWDVSASMGQQTTCELKSTVPLAPTDLTATLSVSGTGGVVSLSWTAGDSNTDSYTIKAKTSNTGTYSDLITELSGTTYTDTLSSGTKWYRVYGVNASGTSTGSNVVSVNYSSE